MQADDGLLDRNIASAEHAAHWRNFDRTLQEAKALLADIPAHERQAVIVGVGCLL